MPREEEANRQGPETSIHNMEACSHAEATSAYFGATQSGVQKLEEQAEGDRKASSRTFNKRTSAGVRRAGPIEESATTTARRSGIEEWSATTTPSTNAHSAGPALHEQINFVAPSSLNAVDVANLVNGFAKLEHFSVELFFM